MNIQDKLRASSVTRWHIVATKKRQSLAEHSFNVAVIYDEICQRRGVVGSVSALGMKAAIYHDIDEVIHGDIPSPAKPPKAEESAMTGRLLKIADLIEAYTFIQMNYVDQHGIQVVQDCYRRMDKAIKELPEGDQKIAIDIVDDILEGRYQM